MCQTWMDLLHKDATISNPKITIVSIGNGQLKQSMILIYPLLKVLYVSFKITFYVENHLLLDLIF